MFFKDKQKKGANPVPEAPTWVGSGEEKNRGKPSPPKICREAASNPRPWDSSHHCTRPALHMFYRLLYYILGLTCHAEWKLKYQSILHHPKKSKASTFSLWACYMVLDTAKCKWWCMLINLHKSIWHIKHTDPAKFKMQQVWQQIEAKSTINQI